VKRRKLIDAGWFYKPIHTAEVLEDRTLLFAPVANDDSYSTAEDTQLVVTTPGVLGNDSDMDFDPLTASLVQNVSHGTLTLNSNGSFTYDPTTAYNGLDTFTYVANDGTQNSNTATVTITVGTNTPPVAVDDAYTVKKGYLDTDVELLDGVIVNDSDADSNPLTATLQSGPANGTILDWTPGIKFGPNGEFKYRPNDEFFGNDTFTYQLSDGQDTDTATVTLTVVDTFDARTDEANPGTTNVSWHGNIGTSGVGGDAATAISTDPYGGLFYSATSNANPIVSVETKVGTDAVIPDSIEVQVTVGTVTENSVFFSTAGLLAGDTVRFAVQVDASTLDSGVYVYQAMVIAHYGSETNKQKYTGYLRLDNLANSTLGDGWDYTGLERLAIQSDGVLHIQGNGTLDWYAVDMLGAYTGEPGEAAFKTLSKNIMTNDFTLTDKYGNISKFDSNGYLTSREDANGNTFTFAYVDADTDGATDDISTMTDPFGRVTTFAYSSGLLSTITDFASRVTTVTHDGSGRITKVTLPDPDGAGGDPSPEVDYAYSGTTFLLTLITDPNNNATSLEYDFAGRLKKITNPDLSTKQFAPLRVQGLVDPASGLGTSSNPAAIVETLATTYSWTDELGHITTTTRTASGSNVTVTDAAGNATAYELDANGLTTKITEADPDGAGPKTAPVTTYEYDTKGNRTKVTNPDLTTRTWVYNSNNMPTSFTNELAKVTNYTYDTNRNLLTVTNPESEKTTYT